MRLQPDVAFWQCVAPMLYQRAVTFDGGEPKVNVRQQAEITDFCNGWMLNIREQQSL